MIGAAGYLYQPPVAVISPGIALDVTGDIEITGVPVDDVNGEYMLTSVSISSEPNALEGRVELADRRADRWSRTSCPKA